MTENNNQNDEPEVLSQADFEAALANLIRVSDTGGDSGSDSCSRSSCDPDCPDPDPCDPEMECCPEDEE